MYNSLLSPMVWGLLVVALLAYTVYRFFHYRNKRKIDQARANLNKIVEDDQW